MGPHTQPNADPHLVERLHHMTPVGERGSVFIGLVEHKVTEQLQQVSVPCL